MDGDLRGRVTEMVVELAAMNELKTQLKECKFENRKLKLDNMRLNKMLDGQEG